MTSVQAMCLAKTPTLPGNMPLVEQYNDFSSGNMSSGMVPTLPGEIISVFLKCNLVCVETSKCACTHPPTHPPTHTHTHTHTCTRTHTCTPFSYSNMSPGWVGCGGKGGEC